MQQFFNVEFSYKCFLPEVDERIIMSDQVDHIVVDVVLVRISSHKNQWT